MEPLEPLIKLSWGFYFFPIVSGSTQVAAGGVLDAVVAVRAIGVPLILQTLWLLQSGLTLDSIKLVTSKSLELRVGKMIEKSTFYSFN